MKHSTEGSTFETSPQVLTQLLKEVSEIRKLLIDRSNEQPVVNSDRWMNITELRDYHPDRPQEVTIYHWVRHGIVPVHKDGRKLRFLKSEIDAWLLRGRKRTGNKVYKETGLDAKGGPNE